MYLEENPSEAKNLNGDNSEPKISETFALNVGICWYSRKDAQSAGIADTQVLESISLTTCAESYQKLRYYFHYRILNSYFQ